MRVQGIEQERKRAEEKNVTVHIDYLFVTAFEYEMVDKYGLARPPERVMMEIPVFIHDFQANPFTGYILGELEERFRIRGFRIEFKPGRIGYEDIDMHILVVVAY